MNLQSPVVTALICCLIAGTTPAHAWLFHHHKKTDDATEQQQQTTQPIPQAVPNSKPSTRGLNQPTFSPPVKRQTQPPTPAPNYYSGAGRNPLPVTPQDSTDSSFPITPAVMPPPVPPREPLANAPVIPPEVSNFPTTQDVDGGPVKPPLSWRAKAYKLQTSNDGVSCTLNCNYDDAVMALLAALPAAGLRVEVLNTKAGELLAAPTDQQVKQRYVFTLIESDASAVLIKGAAMNSNKQSNAVVQNILQTLSAAPQKRSQL